MFIKPKISVIVPVYNTAKYITKCINSISTQSLTDIEIIVVNDCSPDNSLDVIKKLTVKDNRIVIVDKTINEGLELARRSGIQIAKGDYISHVDSDDWLEKDALKKLYEEAILNNSDIVIGNHSRVLDKFGLIKKKSNLDVFRKNILLTRKEFMENYYQGFFGINIIPVTMWASIYKKEFLDSLEIETLNFNMGEDLNYNIQVFPEAQRISFIEDCVYYYRFGGMTTRFNEKIIDAALKMFDVKKLMMDRYNYHHIYRFMIYELKNYLGTYIEMLIRYRPYSEMDSQLIVNKLIQDKRYEEVIEFYRQDDTVCEEFVIALINKDVPLMFEIIRVKYNKKRINLLLKQRVSKLLS